MNGGESVVVRLMEAFAVASVYMYLTIWKGRITHRGHIAVSVLVVDAYPSSLPSKFFSNDEASPIV